MTGIGDKVRFDLPMFETMKSIRQVTLDYAKQVIKDWSTTRYDYSKEDEALWLVKVEEALDDKRTHDIYLKELLRHGTDCMSCAVEKLVEQVRRENEGEFSASSDRKVYKTIMVEGVLSLKFPTHYNVRVEVPREMVQRTESGTIRRSLGTVEVDEKALVKWFMRTHKLNAPMLLDIAKHTDSINMYAFDWKCLNGETLEEEQVSVSKKGEDFTRRDRTADIYDEGLL